MNDQNETDVQDTMMFRAALSVPVILVGLMVANLNSLPIDFSPYLHRLRLEPVRYLFTVGYAVQILSSCTLAMALVFNMPKSARAALFAWASSLCLLMAPVPTVRENPAAAILPLAVVVMVCQLVWTLGPALREPVPAGAA